MRTICEPCGMVKFEDSDKFDIADIVVEPAPGWVMIGDTGYINDYGWNDVPWSEIPGCEDFARETVIREMPDLPGGFDYIAAKHMDDCYNRQGTSDSRAWFIFFVFQKTK